MTLDKPGRVIRRIKFLWEATSPPKKTCYLHHLMGNWWQHVLQARGVCLPKQNSGTFHKRLTDLRNCLTTYVRTYVRAYRTASTTNLLAVSLNKSANQPTQTRLCVYVCVCMYVRMYVGVCVCVCMYACLSVRPPVFQSASLSVSYCVYGTTDHWGQGSSVFLIQSEC
jgi:hypothetical protein